MQSLPLKKKKKKINLTGYSDGIKQLLRSRGDDKSLHPSVHALWDTIQNI